jgi:hypothetical protein
MLVASLGRRGRRGLGRVLHMLTHFCTVCLSWGGAGRGGAGQDAAAGIVCCYVVSAAAVVNSFCCQGLLPLLQCVSCSCLCVQGTSLFLEPTAVTVGVHHPCGAALQQCCPPPQLIAQSSSGLFVGWLCMCVPPPGGGPRQRVVQGESSHSYDQPESSQGQGPAAAVGQATGTRIHQVRQQPLGHTDTSFPSCWIFSLFAGYPLVMTSAFNHHLTHLTLNISFIL